MFGDVRLSERLLREGGEVDFFIEGVGSDVRLNLSRHLVKEELFNLLFTNIPLLYQDQELVIENMVRSLSRVISEREEFMAFAGALERIPEPLGEELENLLNSRN